MDLLSIILNSIIEKIVRDKILFVIVIKSTYLGEWVIIRRVTTVFLLILICFTSCQKNDQTSIGVDTDQKTIDAIYIYHEAFGQRYPEYKIDLINKKFWEFTSDGYENFTARDSSSDNEGFTFVCNLEDDKIETFILDSSRYGFTNWEKSYKNNNIVDGHQWGITIMFSDSKKKEIIGSNKYPETWNDMYEAFENLTDKNVLLFKGE